MNWGACQDASLLWLQKGILGIWLALMGSLACHTRSRCRTRLGRRCGSCRAVNSCDRAIGTLCDAIIVNLSAVGADYFITGSALNPEPGFRLSWIVYPVRSLCLATAAAGFSYFAHCLAPLVMG